MNVNTQSIHYRRNSWLNAPSVSVGQTPIAELHSLWQAATAATTQAESAFNQAMASHSGYDDADAMLQAAIQRWNAVKAHYASLTLGAAGPIASMLVAPADTEIARLRKDIFLLREDRQRFPLPSSLLAPGSQFSPPSSLAAPGATDPVVSDKTKTVALYVLGAGALYLLLRR